MRYSPLSLIGDPQPVMIPHSAAQYSPLQADLLEQSFEQVAPQADEFIHSFYENLFADYPAIKPLFSHTNMEEQGDKLLLSLVFVIENLKDPDLLAEKLHGLGARHAEYGTRPEHYPFVGNSLLKTFEQYLGTDWTEEVKTAWTQAYNVITKVMLDGADYSPAAVKL